MKFIEINPAYIDHDIFPKHFHTEKRKIDHDYKKCIKDANNDDNKKKICLDKKLNKLKNKFFYNDNDNEGTFTISSFLLNGLKIFTSGNTFEMIYYAFTFFVIIIIVGILMLIFWYLLLFFDYLTIKRFFWNNFPGPFIMKPLDFYFKRIHIYIIYIAFLGFMCLLGVIILLYFFKKMFGWWPASWVWSSIGLFKGSKIPFRWIDSVLGCFGSSGPFLCNQQAMWNLVEDWIVYTCKKDRSACKNKSDNDIRNALNAFKNISLDINNTEKFTNYDDTIFKNSPEFKNKLFNYIENFDFIDEYKYKIYDNLIYRKNKYDETGDSGENEKNNLYNSDDNE